MSVIERIGWDKVNYGKDEDNRPCIILLVNQQSPDIAMGVDKGGAGDQGMMYGYATNETAELLPLPFVVATRFLELLRDYNSPMLKADAKAQVSFDYDTWTIKTFLCSVQTFPGASMYAVRKQVKTLMQSVASELALNTEFEVLVNPTGRFVIGGPAGDTGLTGRKIIVDTYGGKGAHGGGAFSGKDPSKVDRSAAYAARYIAKNLVAAGVADECLVQLAYAIGVAKPVSVFVDTYGTAKNGLKDGEIAKKVAELFDLRPAKIIKKFGLKNPIYTPTASYGHMGRTPYTKAVTVQGKPKIVQFFGWELLDSVPAVKKAFGIA
jgi:S-adenosylmethionine synthetase